MELSREIKKIQWAASAAALLLLALLAVACCALLYDAQRERLALIGSLAEQNEELAKELVDVMFALEPLRENVQAGEKLIESCGYSAQGAQYLAEIRNRDILRRQGIIPALGVLGCGLLLGLLFWRLGRLREGLLFYEQERNRLLGRLEESERQARGLENFLEKKNRQMQEFVENISHQIKNPLSCISVAMDTAIDRQDLGELEAAFRYVDKIKGLLKRLLTIGRLEAGKILLHFENLDMKSYLYEVAEEVREKGKRCVFTAEGENFNLHVDPEWLGEAVWNVVNNCMEHTGENGEIQISLHSNTEAVTLSVSDDGESIDEESMPYIFDRFYTTGRADYSHTGIGLNLAKLIAEQHHAVLKAGNRSGDGRTEFLFIFPQYSLKNKSAL